MAHEGAIGRLTMSLDVKSRRLIVERADETVRFSTALLHSAAPRLIALDDGVITIHGDNRTVRYRMVNVDSDDHVIARRID